MVACQALVRDLHRTRCLSFEGSAVSGSALRDAVAAATGLPPADFRLVAGSREVLNGAVLRAGADGLLPSCTVLLRLCGGKVRAARERRGRLRSCAAGWCCRAGREAAHRRCVQAGHADSALPTSHREASAHCCAAPARAPS
jgi:hypothetical protein